MSRTSKVVNPVYSAEIEASIIADLRIELATKDLTNGSVTYGINRRFRNRFSKEAGLDYSAAHAAFYKVYNEFR